MISWLASSQGMEANFLMGKVDLATHQTMQPMLGDVKGTSEQSDFTTLVAAAQEDHGAGQWRVQVESEARRETAALWSGLTPDRGFGVVCSDVARRNAL